MRINRLLSLLTIMLLGAAMLPLGMTTEATAKQLCVPGVDPDCTVCDDYVQCPYVEGVPVDSHALIVRAMHQTGLFIQCGASYEGEDAYQVREQVQGSNYAITILEGYFYGGIRVAFNAQLDKSYLGTTVILDTASETYRSAHDAQMTGACGVFAGFHHWDEYDVKVVFGGADVERVAWRETTESMTVSATVRSGFSISLDNLGASTEVEYGVSGTFTIAEGYQVSVTSTRVAFQQRDYSPCYDICLPSPKLGLE